MFCAISSIPYYGLDYTVSNPLDMSSRSNNRSKLVQETAFLDGKASDRNTRKNRGVMEEEKNGNVVFVNSEHLMLHYMIKELMIYLQLKT